MKILTLLVILFSIVSCSNLYESKTNKVAKEIHNKQLISVLVVDGQNNHKVWPKSTVMMKQYLEETGIFEVTVYRTKSTWKNDLHADYYALHSDKSHFKAAKPETDHSFAPNFSKYDVVVSNFGWKAAPWPKSTQLAFENYMKNGGGFVTIHSANNAFPKWSAYNKMTGLGGWGGRNESDGPYVYYNNDGTLVKDSTKGPSGTHGDKHEFQITKRNDHEILRGLPSVWMHTKDECYGKLRGPAQNLTVLATALCPKEQKGTGQHEPMLMAIDFGKGRIFHTTLGHDDYSFESIGFITTFLRGVEWAATGLVTQHVPDDFPTSTTSKKRLFRLN